MNYCIYPEVIEKIEFSTLNERLQKWSKELYLIPFFTDDEIKDYLTWFNEIWTWESISIANRIINILERPELHTRKIGKWRDLQLSLIEWLERYSIYEEEERKEFNQNDIMLMTWANIFEILTLDEIKNYKKYWFETLIDFIMHIEAYLKSKSDTYSNNSIAYKWKRNWKKTIISACEHWDFRLFQFDETQYPVKSPYWNFVKFRPEIYNILSSTHSVEIVFFSIILRYADQIWYQLNIKEIEELTKTTWDCLGNFWEFWWDNSFDKNNLKLAFLHEIPKENSWKNWLLFTMSYWNEWYYSFLLEDDNNLIIKLNNEKIVARFSPEDIDDLIKWVIIQCSNWLWRTSKSRVLNILKYKVSKEFKDELLSFSNK